MASRQATTRSYSRRFAWLAAAIVVVVAAYTGAWFYAAGVIEPRIGEAMRASGGDPVPRCERPSARGYPFRIGVFCDAVAFEDARGGISVRAGAFRSAAQVYDPFHAVGELDGPLEADIAGIGPVRLDWKFLHASARLDTPLPERVSVEGDDLALATGTTGTGAPPVASADHLELHARTRGDDLDVATSADGVAFDLPGGEGLPVLGARIDATIADGARLLRQGRFDGLRGRSAEFRDLTLVAGGSPVLSLKGLASVAGDGLVDGDMTATVEDPAALANLLRRLFPEQADAIRAATSGLSALGGSASVPVSVRRGEARIGFIALGRIPPL